MPPTAAYSGYWSCCTPSDDYYICFFHLALLLFEELFDYLAMITTIANTFFPTARVARGYQTKY